MNIPVTVSSIRQWCSIRPVSIKRLVRLSVKNYVLSATERPQHSWVVLLSKALRNIMGERRGTKGLELWCRRMTEGYPGVAVNNMTTSWRDGLAFCAIIHHFRPDLIDFSKLNKDDIYYNNDLAFQTAERHLGIPALLEPEDMVEYPVPDRLSILTYLSQYYQTFVVAQGSPSRIVPKRPANASGGSVVSPSSTSPSPKIPRPSGGVGRRDPCAKCGLPVFIAERLNVGKQLYHRTCFRCARCNSQLTLANYYETETNNQFCCEVCPDEENRDLIDVEKKSVLSRSLSDEEKSAGLQHYDDDDGGACTFETARDESSPKDMEQSSEYTLARSSFINSQLIHENESKSEEEPPDLPKSAPPIVTKSEIPDLPNTSPPLPSKSEPPDLKRNSENIVTVDRVKDLNSSSIISSAPIDSYKSDQSVETVVYNSDKLSEDANVNQPQTAIQLDLKNSTKENKNFENNRTSLVKSLMLVFEKKEADEDLSPKSSTEKSMVEEVPLSSQQESLESNHCVDSSLGRTKNNENHAKEESIGNLKIEQHEYEESGVNVVISDEYPEDLNPFGDEDEEAANKDTVSAQPKPALRKKLINKIRVVEPPSYNPFDDEDDDIEEEIKNKSEDTSRVSLNPFWSDGEEPEDEIEKKVEKPVPLPRNPRSLVNTPEPKPRKTSLLIAKDAFGSNSSLNSAASSVGTSSRKKKPAPKPPVFEKQDSPFSSITSSPAPSVQHSPRATPKFRKTKRAPAPPPPPTISTPINNDPSLSTCSLSPINISSSNDRSPDLEEEKIIKDELNKNRQSQIITSDSSTDLDFTPDKSTYGKWKRRKGPAPCRPIPQRRHIKPLPTAEIKRELDFIEIQQQGLEKQGVKLEQIIRDKCEGPNINSETALSPEVEDLILQLFELVNEKNDLFRKQAELMYLRRQQRLEEEYADLEYQIRCLMLQPEANKTDSDKAREEELINRLVEVVERRNEIVECLEMDRIREAEEDDSINNQLTLYTLKRSDATAKLKEQKKKHKKERKFKFKSHKKIDDDKDVDESEVSVGTSSSAKEKKKKKFTIFS
ncbi:hypothetical protein FQR65_LT07186 [Abscondita terminalis]|nr:hypothetical protein FQR65_LT07186 [Abscondita terminalis]